MLWGGRTRAGCVAFHLSSSVLSVTCSKKLDRTKVYGVTRCFDQYKLKTAGGNRETSRQAGIHPERLVTTRNPDQFQTDHRLGPKHSGLASEIADQVFHGYRFDKSSCVSAGYERFEMCGATFDLGAFLVTQIVQEQAALGFDDEIQLLSAALIDQNRPVWTVGTERRADLKPGW